MPTPLNWPADFPERIPGRIWMPDPDHSRQRRMPEGVVIHSGDHRPRVAESALNDGRDVSYHFAHSAGKERLVQLVSLRRRAWHAGSEGNDWIGIGLSGPDEQCPRDIREKTDFMLLIGELQIAFCWSLKWWCRHSDITPGKTDPGPGFTEEWMAGSGMTWGKPNP